MNILGKKQLSLCVSAPQEAINNHPPHTHMSPWSDFVKLTKDMTLCMKESRHLKRPNFVRISLEKGICNVMYIHIRIHIMATV